MFRGLALLGVCLLLSGCTAALPVSSSLSSLLGGNPPTDLHEQTECQTVAGQLRAGEDQRGGPEQGIQPAGLRYDCPGYVEPGDEPNVASPQMRLDGAQTVANVIVEHSSSYWILFGIPKVEVHADVVEFRPQAAAGQQGKPLPPHAKPTE